MHTLLLSYCNYAHTIIHYYSCMCSDCLLKLVVCLLLNDWLLYYHTKRGSEGRSLAGLFTDMVNKLLNEGLQWSCYNYPTELICSLFVIVVAFITEFLTCTW